MKAGTACKAIFEPTEEEEQEEEDDSNDDDDDDNTNHTNVWYYLFIEGL